MTEFKYKKASDWRFKDIIQIQTLEELLEFIKNTECKSIIIDYDDDCDKYTIIDYDDYVE